ncbi:MAG: flagellar motor switch protein FliG, partial [Ligilactobacillus ruminis]|nr:flagellar motor switch protein FliG [Ligilactobacillus ruminis]
MAELSGIKRAAILMIALGSETSSKIMKQLPESMIQQV